MLLRGRIAVVSLLAFGALAAVGTAVVQAAGEKSTVTLKVSPAKPKIGKSGKPVPVKLSFDSKIIPPAGQREAAVKTVDATFPKGLTMDAKGFKTCSVATIKANKPKECPAKSVIAHHQSLLNAVPLFANPVHLTGNVFMTGRTATGLTWASYLTVTEAPTLHGVQTGTVKLSDGVVKFHEDAPRAHTAPGLPDATSIEFDFQFDARGTDSVTLLRAKKACASSWAMPLKFGFYDGSSTSSTGKAAC